ncbi:15010_t:CDS:2 [Racocetra fulgida]|uniref:15010_t:CDS:1 n=1 Tax=Racocetra fulgida TaxID=60492 RepID=A0A9N8VWJ8_9GLOM|nr:15010_t:CDS:2 [Racocetra fulgida]
MADKNSLSVSQTSTIIEPPVAKNTKNKKKSSVIKNTTIIKPSSTTTKPYERTRSYRKLTDLAKQVLTNSNESEITSPVSTNTPTK